MIARREGDPDAAQPCLRASRPKDWLFRSFSAARRCAELREGLGRQGKRVRSRALDLVTAAIALELGYTLVTRNRADYADIPDLLLAEP